MKLVRALYGLGRLPEMTTADLQQLSALLHPIFRKHGVLKAIVFGSVARGESSRQSDLDLIVIKETQARFLDRYDEILHDITKAVQRFDVDLLIYTPDELASMANRPWIANALKEGKVLYESEQEPASS
jgi:predicted nucleotidyltransferase